MASRWCDDMMRNYNCICSVSKEILEDNVWFSSVERKKAHASSLNLITLPVLNDHRTISCAEKNIKSAKEIFKSTFALIKIFLAWKYNSFGVRYFIKNINWQIISKKFRENKISITNISFLGLPTLEKIKMLRVWTNKILKNSYVLLETIRVKNLFRS